MSKEKLKCRPIKEKQQLVCEDGSQASFQDLRERECKSDGKGNVKCNEGTEFKVV